MAFMAALVGGMLQITTEEVQLMRNQIYAAEALAIAEAGLNDAFAELRADDEWADEFVDKTFLPTMLPPVTGGSYTVTVSGSLPNLTVESTATTDKGFVARIAADITVGSTSPHLIRIDELRINEEEGSTGHHGGHHHH